MIFDLNQQGPAECDVDVLVIGGGTVGLIVAARLSGYGLRVVVLESGGLRQDAEVHPLNEVVYRRARYAGAEHGRFRCLGGTSTRWGGALIPFQPADIDQHDWPISSADVAPYVSPVEELFRLPAGPYEDPEILGRPGDESLDHIARLAKWPAFANRNVAHLLSAAIRSAPGPTVWLNATVTRFVADSGHLREVIAESQQGRSIRVRAKEVVVAAGAIESTRLLLVMDSQNGRSIFRDDDQAGRYFHDHLSVKVGTLDVADRKSFNRVVGFRFEKNGGMRNVRFELAQNSPRRRDIPPHFAHVAFQESSAGGFDALREFFRGVQQRRLPDTATIWKLAASSPWLARAAWWRYAERRLLYPTDAELEVHLVIQQTPRPDNRISLSGTRSDIFGIPLAEIDWSVDRCDAANVAAATEIFKNSWAQSRLASMARFVDRNEADIYAELESGGGIYHPGGSTRMGCAPEKAVVDGDLRLFRMPNVSVVATSVLPTGGGANPTMLLIMLGMRCTERLAAQLG